MRSLVVVLALASGCGYPDLPVVGQGASDDAGQPVTDGIVRSGCAFSAQTDTCQLTFGAALTLTGTLTFDTDAGTLTDAGGAIVAVAHSTISTPGAAVEAIYAHDITLTANTKLRATGSKPFALFALGNLTLADNALIDVSVGGAGARTSCNTGGQSDPSIGGNNNDGAGGGGGAGYGAAGGDGGNGNSDTIFGSQTAGGKRGSPMIVIPAGPLGGCPGATGGQGDNPGGSGGPGGGALLLSAGGTIALGTAIAPGLLNAGGGGGAGGTRTVSDGDAGGGGGGSGGMLWLEAAHITGRFAILAANGGGGGEGSGDSKVGMPGNPGALSSSPAAGGTGGTDTGADGGTGGSLFNLATKPTSVQIGGGGGGGGGVGFIALVSPDIGALAIVSPTQSPPVP